MKKTVSFLALLLALAILCSCGNQTRPDTPNGTDTANGGTTTVPEIPSVTPTEPSGGTAAKFPSELSEIPQSYFAASNAPGELRELSYDTYESFSYEQHSQLLRKRAIVYLPHGYDEGKQYNILYLMHGGWSNETSTLGTPERPSDFKNVIDNAIAQGDFAPLIIVCPTYNNTSGQDSADFSLALRLTRNYHNELVNDLIPAVESAFSTYAAGISADGLMAARDHRAFGGFSMGSVTTWRTFEYALDYFRSFIPMSCGTSLDDESIWRAAEGRSQNDYFVMMMVGTSDFSYSYDTARAEDMRASAYFTEQTQTTDGNFVFRIKDGYSHNGIAANEYTYNAMRYLWKNASTAAAYTADTKIADVIADPTFGDFGRLIFPVDSGYYSRETLGDLRLTWYSHIDPAHTVAICNYFKEETQNGRQVFYDIYSEEEKTADPQKADTGLFFFRGNPGAKFAVTCAGGGFAYVGAMHDSFPHALELSRRGYNAFAVIYRPGAQTAYEDLARAISFIFANADTLGVDTDGYSVWGGSAGGRMAATIASYGVEPFGGSAGIPKPSVAVIQYTGHTDYNPASEPATFVTVGESDGIANYRTMKRRIDALAAMGVPTEYHSYPGLGHGFGIGIGTVAEGWLDLAVAFWKKNC